VVEVVDMAYSVDVDIGGTLTDGLFSDGRRAETVKVDTTPHDFTVCFFDCLREGARRFGHDDLRTFVRDVDVMRWSSTISTNVVAERKGPKVGLILSEGPAGHLYGDSPSPAVGFLVAPEHVAVVGARDDRTEILRAVRELLEAGVRRICISFAGGGGAAAAERRAKEWVEQQYPDHYLGSVPVLLGYDMLEHPDDRTRTHLALLNAYVHTPLASGLFKAEDELIDLRYRHPVYVGHVNGGVARIAKTKGVDTTESGPVFGLAASAHFARLYGLGSVLSLDVGGTTTKLGGIVDGAAAVADRGELFGVPLAVPWVVLHSAALGGGSVARVVGGEVTLGPDSMGAYPGPACYGLGSTLATLTDALVAAGMVNPDRFLGGHRKLSIDLARSAVEQAVAEPLGVSLDTALDRVLRRAVQTIASVAHQDLAGSTLFAFGGNGANLAVAAAEALGCRRAVVFRMGPVFSALGSSLAQVRHVQESWPYLRLGEADAAERLAGSLERSREVLVRDVAGEGFRPESAVMVSELLLRDERGTRTVRVDPDGGSYQDALGRLASAGNGSSPVVERVSVTAVCAVPRFEIPREEPVRHTPEPSGTRSLATSGRRQGAAVHDWDTLRPGAEIVGPAVLDGAVNSCTVPEGWRFQLDGYGNGIITPAEG
jgi:N-methylhydantoinase A